MKILQVHNVYIGKTGEETVVEEERKVLEQHGNHVIQFIKDNSDLQKFAFGDKIKTYGSLLSSKRIEIELRELIKTEQPDVCHVHNTFPLITPVVYSVCQQMEVPVIKTLHNYKLVCTNSLMFRNGEICELCLNKSLYNSIKYKCYRNSYLATAVQARVIQHHRNKGTWDQKIDQYVCLTEFQKDKLISGGLPAEKVTVKPNFIGQDSLPVTYEDFFLFVGKIGDYKGLQDLLYLFKQNEHSKFVIIGQSEDPSVFDPFTNVQYLGEQGRGVVLDHMRRCKVVIFPSLYYEGMPMVILEAFSHKKAVISRDRGAMSSMVIHGYNGLKYEVLEDLISAVNKFERNDSKTRELGENAFQEYLSKYSEEQGYNNLMELYDEVIKMRSTNLQALDE